MTLGGFGGAGPRTIFQIGSVTKVFTALLLADMAERGELSLSDPAARYLPGDGEAVTAAVARPAAVTLADLATHTSGLPRLPRSMLWYSLLSPRDPYARYPASRFLRAARRSLRTACGGSSYAYSNYGFGLLGYLLGQAAGSAYETLVTERICGPLGLRDTTFAVPGASGDRTAQGHRRGRAVPAWHLGALAGAGGLYSTAADMGTFLQACLRPATAPLAAAPLAAAPATATPLAAAPLAAAPATPLAATPLAAAIRVTLAPRQPVPAGEIGLAWHLTRLGDRTVTWHNGMTGGFSSMIAFDPVRKLGVAALANAAGLPPSPLDRAVFSAFR